MLARTELVTPHIVDYWAAPFAAKNFGKVFLRKCAFSLLFREEMELSWAATCSWGMLIGWGSANERLWWGEPLDMTWITQAAALCSLLLHAQAYVVPSKKQDWLQLSHIHISLFFFSPSPSLFKVCLGLIFVSFLWPLLWLDLFIHTWNKWSIFSLIVL